MIAWLALELQPGLGHRTRLPGRGEGPALTLLRPLAYRMVQE